MAPALLLLLFGVVTAGLSLQIRVGTLRAPGSGFFPFYLGLLLILLAAIHLAQLWREGRSLPAGDQGAGTQGSWQRVLIFLGATVLATGLLTVLGYPLAAFLLMALLLYILGVRRWVHVVVIALCAAGVSYALFVRWLQIPLPMAGFGL
jgi:putative tricarboxylic transport membrane protein